MSVETELRALNRKVEMQQETLTQILIRMEEVPHVRQRVDVHDRMLYGHNGTPGLKGRVQTLWESEERRKWHIRTVWAFVLALAGGMIHQLFSR